LSRFWWRTHRRPDGPRFFTGAQLAGVQRFYAAAGASLTPLRHLRALARELGLGGVLAKDESQRFGLPAFKIAGAQYAVARLIEHDEASARELACATAGNHGRAVAHAGRLHGRPVHVYVPVGTADARVAALRAEGADVVVTTVGYDAAVRLMARDAAANGWQIVSDTAWEGYEEIPRDIMAGYTRIMDEAAGQWGDSPPDVVIVQAGVGSLAGAVAGWLEYASGPRPHLIIAEPIGSASVLASLDAGSRVTLESCAPTAMVGLRSAEVSTIAWPVLASGADAAVAVGEPLADEAIARLAHPSPGDDAAIATAASGAAGLAALFALVRDPDAAELRASLGLGPATRVMMLVTEGRTA
jgi:diaminopropionate ammonia-lyase